MPSVYFFFFVFFVIFVVLLHRFSSSDEGFGWTKFLLKADAR